jgi:hypothetical protein
MEIVEDTVVGDPHIHAARLAQKLYIAGPLTFILDVDLRLLLKQRLTLLGRRLFGRSLLCKYFAGEQKYGCA